MERRRLTAPGDVALAPGKRADIRLFSSDLDGTLVGNPEATWRFAGVWETLPRGTRPLLVYNTGRSVEDTRRLVEARGLPDPDYIIGGLGTELYDSLYQRGDVFRARFGSGWDLTRVDDIVAELPGVRRQPSEFLHPFKSSWYWSRARPDQVDELRSRLAAARLRATVIYSCRYFLDVLPACAGKGRALTWLCETLGVPLSRVLVAGDTGNDTDMFVLPGVKGLLVENALPELRLAAARGDAFAATQPMADGVIEGLRAFGIVPPERAAAGTADAPGWRH